MKSKVIAGTTAAALALTTTFAVSADNAKYPHDYTIENVLSDYGIFVSGDFKTSSHIAGAVAVGGTLEVGSFGDASVIPSYAHNLKFGSYNEGNWLDESIRSNTVYYGSSSNDVSRSNFIKNDNYIDFTTAMDKISKQSQLIAKNAASVKDGSYDVSTRKITIDLSTYSSKSIVMPYELFDSAEIIDFTGVDLKTFATGGYTITVTGGEGKTIDFGYTSWGSGKHILLNGNGLDNAFKNLDGSIQGGQVNLKGTNLIFNFPDATEINLNMLAGAVVAPNANVYIAGGNFEGNLIAASAGSQGEGHFFPYYAPGTRNTYSDVGLDSKPAETTTTTTTTKDTTTTSETTTTTEGTTTTTSAAETTTTTPAPTTSETETPAPTTTTTAPVTTEPTTTPPATTTSEVTTTTPTTTTTGSNGDDDDDQPTETTTTTGPKGDDEDETETTTTSSETTTTTKPSDVADENGTGTSKTTTTSTPKEGHDDSDDNNGGNGDDGDVDSGESTKTTTKPSIPSTSTDNQTDSFTSDNPSTGMGAYASMSVASLLTVAAAMFIGKKKFSDKK